MDGILETTDETADRNEEIHDEDEVDDGTLRAEQAEEEEEDDDDEEVVVHHKAARKIIEDDDDEEDAEPGDDKAEKKLDDSDDEADVEKSRGKGKAAKKDDDDDDDEEDDDDDDDEDDDDDDDEEDADKAEDNDKVEEDGEDDDKVPEQDEEEEDEEDERKASQNSTIYDFDIMMAKKKEENSRKRKRRNYDIINDNDDIIADIINQMKDAVEADSEANKNKIAATRKLKLLPFVTSQLRKVDLRDAFLDSDVLGVMTEWLAPLPDRSLPHLHIRESLLKILIDFNIYDIDRIKGSGIGKAIMYLYKHPKETKENKQRAKQLISCWSRPIFQLDSSFNAISREEREQRDLELMSKQRRASRQNDSSDGEGPGPSSGGPKKAKEDGAAQKPGDKGWIPRARVPAPSMKDYVIRPRSKVDGEVGKSSKRPTNMLEKYMKSQQERRRSGKQQRAVNMKIDRN